MPDDAEPDTSSPDIEPLRIFAIGLAIALTVAWAILG